MDTFKIIGHRGACGYYPENTLASFEHAIALGVKWVELDVRFSKEGHPVVLHDRSLGRTTPLRGWVDYTSLATLEEHGVPTLVQVLNLLEQHEVGCYVEIKKASASQLDQLAAILQARERGHVVSSFDHGYLKTLRRFNASLPIQVLFSRLPYRPPRYLDALNPFEIGGGFYQMSELTAKRALEWGYPLCAYTVNNPGDMRNVQEWGLAGVFTDFPDRTPYWPLNPLVENPF